MGDQFPASTSVREMPEEDRPRERLARLGPEALRDAELLAILLRTGTAKTSAVTLGERIIAEFGDLRGLARATVEELQKIPGVGPAKAVELQAALELGRRLRALKRTDRPKIRGAADVAELLMDDFKVYETERFVSVLLDMKNQVMKIREVSRGGIDGTVAAPRDVFREAVRDGASHVIVAHNHPSGDPEPSRADIELTRRLLEASAVIGIPLLDHVVFGDGRYVSLKERQLM